MSLNATALGVVTKKSQHTVQETLNRIENVVRLKGLSIFTLVDHSGEAAKVGLKMPETKLLIFGSPRAGTPLMVASPLVALDLPLKVLVWQDKDQVVWVSYNSISYLSERYKLPGDLTKGIAGIDIIIDSALSN